MLDSRFTIDGHGLTRRRSPGRSLEAARYYLLAVKENQGHLYEDVRDLFQGALEFVRGGPLRWCPDGARTHARDRNLS